jgi:hypothetical protein
MNENPVLVLCLVTGNVAEWAVKHSAETDGETFEGIHFEGDRVTMVTDTGREVSFPESIYKNYDEPSECSVHMIREIDSGGNIGREYQINPPVIAKVAGYRG